MCVSKTEANEMRPAVRTTQRVYKGWRAVVLPSPYASGKLHKGQIWAGTLFFFLFYGETFTASTPCFYRIQSSAVENLFSVCHFSHLFFFFFKTSLYSWQILYKNILTVLNTICNKFKYFFFRFQVKEWKKETETDFTAGRRSYLTRFSFNLNINHEYSALIWWLIHTF